MRETLFNWLSPSIAGANCLDLFAGSGVLGFEALSRGAAYVEMVDQSAEVVKLLKEELETFGAENARIYRAQCASAAEETGRETSLISFFWIRHIRKICYSRHVQYLEENDFLADGAYIYLEAGQAIKDNELPANWRLIKNSARRTSLLPFGLQICKGSRNE